LLIVIVDLLIACSLIVPMPDFHGHPPARIARFGVFELDLAFSPSINSGPSRHFC
jgi:hypothetical protein